MAKLNLFQLIIKAIFIDAFLFIVSLVDYIPEFFLSDREKQNRIKKKSPLAKLTDPRDPRSPYRCVESPELFRIDENVNLYDKFEEAWQMYADVQTLGTREVLAIEDETQSNGKVFKKYDLGAYKWKDYTSIHKHVLDFSNGLLSMGLKSNNNLVLFCETRPEWIMSALACFRINVPVVTLYSTLGIEALKFGINETEATHIITSSDQLVKIEKILKDVPKITHLIVITNPFSVTEISRFKADNRGISVLLMNEVESLGESHSDIEFTKPKKDDLAVIMYTSGSTGNPKGVMMSHENLLTSVESIIKRVNIVSNKDIYIAYLPLAHVLELVCELSAFYHGIRIGYSSAQTMADNSTAIKKGQKGDLRVLKPTFMASVPVILERLCKAVHDKIAQTSWFKQELLKTAYKYKLDAFRHGRKSFLLNRLLFKRISRAVLGGKVRYMISGASLLSEEVQEFISVCLAGVRQAYALTETCASGTAQHPFETDTLVVGPPITAAEIRLVDWDEAGYRCTDKPNPRGEIHIGGYSVAMGYYKMPEKTAEDFYFLNGVRYFATGDIGEVLPNGNLKIIDRKKDLVKLQTGEYVSLNKVETCLKLLQVIDNCCVYAKAFKNSTIVLITPNPKKIIEFAHSIGLEDVTDAKEASANQELIKKFTKLIEQHCLKQGLERFEIPQRIKFVDEIWLPDTGLVTDSLKLKRRNIEVFYAKEIDALYE